ncbi:MAG: protein-L-isoaspartate o-methyltransferase 1 [Thermomicrobiales bacterium]
MSKDSSPPPKLDEAAALELAWRGVEEAGGSRMIYRSPRHPFSMNTTQSYTVDGHEVEIRWGEISSPAVASVSGYVFEIHEEDLELLIRPPRPR